MYSPTIKKPRVLSVSQLNFYIKTLVENDQRLSLVFLTGEISNLTDHYSSGHIYLSLKDEKSLIRAVMFAGNARNLKFKPQNGMKIICRGRIAVYEPNGQYQLYIEDMQPDGVGALSLAYEQLKEKLNSLGYFSSQHKKPVPKFPKTIGVVTSPTGAAVRDIRNILYRRFPCADIVMCPVLVQGDNAPAQLVDAVKRLDENNLCDVIIIGRGGGSIEDLWAFNNEELAQTIFNCKTPVVSAVGHETDFTICDFVSDMRAPTPSAAAELCVPDINELNNSYRSQKQYIKSIMENKIKTHENQHKYCENRINIYSPQNRIKLYKNSLILNKERIMKQGEYLFSEGEKTISKLSSSLDVLSPLKVLSRGYAIVQNDSHIVVSKSEIKKDDELELKFSDGSVRTKVIGD